MSTELAQPLLFAYGSLRRSEHNHHYLRAVPYLGEHVTAAAYTMFDLGAYPAVIATGTTCIQGEVYAIDAPMLVRLDVLEAYPCHYDRQLIDTPWGAAWIYLYRQSLLGYPWVEQGDWLACRRHRDVWQSDPAGS